MAKRIYSATAGVGLDIESTFDFDQYYEVDADAYLETKAIKAETLLRTRPSASFDRSGLGTTAITYSTYNNAIVTITTDNVITIGALGNNETCYLTVEKAAANLVTFSGATLLGTIDAYQTNRTELRFRLDSVDGGIIISQLNNQFGDSLVSTDLTPSSGTITSFSYFNSTINDNICNFEAKFTYTPSASISTVQIDLSNWDVTKYNSGASACPISATEGVLPAPCVATIEEDTLYITYFTAITGASIISVNGSFRIK